MKKEKISKKVRFGKYYAVYNMPCITLEANWKKDWKTDEITMLPEGEWRTEAYLTCFRNYAFQVCGTYDGKSDLGSTEVFGLDTFRSIVQIGTSNLSQENTVKYIIGCVAMDAVDDFMHSIWMPDDIVGPRNCYKWLIGRSEEYDKFIDNCYHKYVENVSIDDVPLHEEDVEEAV